jgi:predicted DCC family thiol-disulfide oxidoreductase YuxK
MPKVRSDSGILQASGPVGYSPGVIVYFDGECNLCNRLVDFVIRRDRRRRFRFAPLQGETARRHLPASLTGTGLETIVLERETGLQFRSDAVLAILATLGGPWSGFGILRVLPRTLRDGAYNYIARNRFRWFGRRETCRVPTLEERRSFLP